MAALVAARDWLMVVQLPLRASESVWWHLKRSLANLVRCSLNRLLPTNYRLGTLALALQLESWKRKLTEADSYLMDTKPRWGYVNADDLVNWLVAAFKLSER
jgi:hypothetical protein